MSQAAVITPGHRPVAQDRSKQAQLLHLGCCVARIPNISAQMLQLCLRALAEHRINMHRTHMMHWWVRVSSIDMHWHHRHVSEQLRTCLQLNTVGHPVAMFRHVDPGRPGAASGHSWLNRCRGVRVQMLQQQDPSDGVQCKSAK